MLWLLSWKNVWRNKLRSIIVIIAVMLGVFAGVFMLAFMNGMVEERIQTVIRTEISHIQIHQPGFLENNDFSLRINNIDSIIHLATQTGHVAAASKRIVISSMVASAETNSGIKIIGIIPDQESKITNIGEKITDGDYFRNQQKNNVVIGKKLAEKLKVGLGKKLIITIQDVSTNITSGAFRVGGIFDTDNDMYDESIIFVRFSDLSLLSGLDGTQAHEIAVILDKDENTDQVKAELRKSLSTLEVMDWMELSPEAGYLVSAMDQYTVIFMVIILLALCFGIINTMLMVVLERVREIGMLMAVGMSKIKVFYMIMLETVYLTMTGGTVGIAAGYFASKYLERVGIDLFFWKEVYASIGYSSLIYPKIDLQTIMIVSLMVIFTGLFSAIYPAFKALKLNPAEATRME